MQLGESNRNSIAFGNMSTKDKIITWINDSDISDEHKLVIEGYFKEFEEEDQLKDFRIQRLKDNLKINTRFLNKAVEDLEKTVTLLKDSNKQLGNFVKIASHDLKSPLRSISSFSALLSRMLGEKLNDKENEYFEIIESSAISMVELIDDLLLFTRINSENLNIEDKELTDLTNDVLNNLMYDIEKTGTTVDCNFEPIVFKCDGIKFKQVLQNLISNSIKFSSSEGNKPHIVLDLKETPSQLCFSVEDNGIGIQEEFRELAFQEFKKLNGHSYEGTGMGLSIVKKIVNQHKGDIWIEPKSGKGTNISFTIAKDLKDEIA